MKAAGASYVFRPAKVNLVASPDAGMYILQARRTGEAALSSSLGAGMRRFISSSSHSSLRPGWIDYTAYRAYKPIGRAGFDTHDDITFSLPLK